MSCHDHPESAATGTCAGCAEPFCGRCLVTVRGATYCASCKSLALSGIASQAVALSQEARAALGLAFAAVVLGMYCRVGIILGPIAVAKAQTARRQIAANPALGGVGWAQAATVVGAAAFAFQLLDLFLKSRQ